MRLYVLFGQLYVTQLQSEFFNVISVARCLDWQSILSILRFLCILRTTQPNQLMNNYHLCLFIFFLGNACTLAKAALLNEIRTLKQAGRHPNIVNLIGTWVQGGEVYFNYPNNILTNLRKKGYPGYICMQNCCGQPTVLPNVYAGSWFEATFSRRRVPINLQQQICS